jgi:hypothetical protein
MNKYLFIVKMSVYDNPYTYTLHSRPKRIYTPINGEEDIKIEASMKKVCLQCPPDANIRPHSSFTMQYEKNDDDSIKGVYRNNTCKNCQKRTSNPKSTIGSLEEEVRILNERMEDKDVRIAAMKSDMESMYRILKNIASHSNLIVRDNGDVVLK